MLHRRREIGNPQVANVSWPKMTPILKDVDSLHRDAFGQELT